MCARCFSSRRTDYITGIFKANEILICTDGDDDKQYLVANPNLVCFEGTHLVLVGINFIAIMVYHVGVLTFYVYLLFHLVPKRGLNDPKLNYNFGFVWNRFEPHCYWWELIDTVRKLGLVLVAQLVSVPAVQSIVGAFLVGIVIAANFYFRPYQKVNARARARHSLRTHTHTVCMLTHPTLDFALVRACDRGTGHLRFL